MARPATKKDLIQTGNINFETLWATIGLMKKEALESDFDFSEDERIKEAHWRRDRNHDPGKLLHLGDLQPLRLGGEKAEGP